MSTTHPQAGLPLTSANPMLYNVCGWELELDSLCMQLDLPHREMLESLGYTDIPDSITLLEYTEAFVMPSHHAILQDCILEAIDHRENTAFNQRFELHLRAVDGSAQAFLFNSWHLRPGLVRGQCQNISDLKEVVFSVVAEDQADGQTVSDATGQKPLAENPFADRLHNLLADVFSMDDTQEAIQLLMRQAAEMSGAAAIGLFRSLSMDNGDVYVSSLSEWDPRGVMAPHLPDMLQSLAMQEEVPGKWLDWVSDGRAFDALMPSPTNSGSVSDSGLLAIPVMVRAQCMGYLCVKAATDGREWNTQDQRNLLTLAQVLMDLVKKDESRKALNTDGLRYRTVLDTMTEGMMVIDAEGYILCCNRSAIEMFGAGIEEGAVFPRNCVDEAGSILSPQSHPAMRTLLTGQELRGQIIGVPDGDDSFRWLSVNASPLISSAIMPARQVLLTCTDVTPQLHTARELEKATQESQRHLLNLFRNCNHNLKLASLFLQLEAPLQDAGSHNMTASIRRIQTLAKVQETLFLKPEATEAGLHSLIDDLRHATLTRLGRNRREINSQITVRTGTRKAGACMPLLLILDELMANAIEHGLGSRMTGQMEVKLEENGDYLMLEVLDNGCGLPPSFHVDHVNTAGLSIVNAILGGVQGTIAMHSDQGTRVMITIPLKNLES